MENNNTNKFLLKRLEGKQLTVVGGGAAGFFCAVNAARMNASLKVVIVEKTSKLLSKVRVSGGGRCNVTHACFEISALVKKYPRGVNILKKAFYHFDTSKCIKWFQERGVKLKTEGDGRMFPDTDSSQTIIDILLEEANKYGVEIRTKSEIKSIKYRDKFNLELSDGTHITSDFVCVACGGYSKNNMYEWLQNLHHTIEEPVPSLFTFNMPGNVITNLKGVTVEKVLVKIAGSKLSEEGSVLITHWGMSGPVILKLSAWAARELANKNYQFTLLVNWIPPLLEIELRDKWNLIRNECSLQKIINRNPFSLPNRLWSFLLAESGITEDMRWADLPSKEQNKLIKNLTAQEFAVSGKTTFKEEFVTCGGIKLNEVDIGTMQSKIVPGLFFAGEILDVDGVTGGFNFQHAWTSGWIAAKAICENSGVEKMPVLSAITQGV